MNPKTNAPRGISVRVTRLDGIGNPCWLTFTKDGQQLSFGIGYSNRDVYCMNLDIGASTISGELTPVATDRYFDGEACWMPDGKSVVFASERGGRGKSDLYRYYIETRETERLTFSETWKSNPRISPNGNALGYFSDGGVWAMPPTGGPAERMTPRTLKLADNPAYAWSADGRTLFLTIPDSAGPYLCTLAELNLTDGSVRKHLSGLAGPDFVLSPKGDQLAISGIPISPNDFSSEKIGVLNLETGRLKILQMQLSLSPRGRLSWSGDGKYILHDRSAPNNETVYELLPVNGGPPRELKMDLGGLNGYGLVDQIDPWGKSVLVSVYSNEMDMWMLGGRKE
jgi:Tol biopolymer transport system component